MQGSRQKHLFAGIALGLLLMTLFLGSGQAMAASSVWGADYFPKVTLITQEGKTVRFFEDLIKDKVVMINFIYTSCPDACLLETAKLREVQTILGDRVGQDVFMYSITIDPQHDTPAVLKQYAQQFQVGPGWLFLTGKEADITLLRTKLGLYGEETKGEDLKDHNLSLVIGNQGTGQWMKSSPYENPYVLATQLGSWLHNWKLPPKGNQNYAKAPSVRKIAKGEDLFRTRCAACHTIGREGGTGDGVTLARAIGPDLLNVTRRRERAWLLRWMAEPDKMLAEKDPLSVAMLAQFNNLPMPNLRLNELETNELYDFIEAESHRADHRHNQGHGHGHALPMPTPAP